MHFTPGCPVSQTIYEMVTSAIITALKEGVVPWRKPWHVDSFLPVNAITNKPYRGVNVLLLSMSRYTDHRWMTFKQAKEKGGTVKKGERSTMVVFWKQWQPPATLTQEEVASARAQHAPILRYYNVFNVEQCEEVNLPEVYRSTPLKEHERIERADLLVRMMPDPPRIVEGGKSAWYRPSDDLVQVPPISTFETADAFYSTLFHELGHSTGHEKRLNRSGVIGDIQFGSGEYSKEELVAELTAAFCCATMSLDNSLTADAASYIQGWLSVLKADPKVVVIAAAQAQRAADHIRGVVYM